MSQVIVTFKESDKVTVDAPAMGLPKRVTVVITPNRSGYEHIHSVDIEFHAPSGKALTGSGSTS